ncbi:PEGA domain-containing protein [candidate division KSB3 bacterium]|uniref:PEGA domain-containing protein n=1 Tax=candidate division KSB3 bacterium TaxID=2044937 RepID=A0A9D5Q714_9BACT|nr:PEGA domain-containing protein [candidate division KSB3 bacterium]MBD3326444.1 PEGA domain-containing protein [candidate division KSB3 bacterium]
MIRHFLSLASIIFVVVCVGAIVGQFVDFPSVWAYVEDFYHIFDNEGTLEVVSTPEAAAVYLDNTFIGQTPLTTDVADGAYDVKIILSGYQTFARRIVVEKEHATTIHANLSQDYGALRVHSTPAKATVYIDGKRQGQLTPLEVQVTQGKYLVRVEKDRFYVYEEDVVVEQGKTMTVEADLVRQVGRVIVETVPPGAKAYIGNDLIGTTPFTHDKPVGKYVLTVKKPGFRDKVIEANIAPDESLDIRVELTERVGGLKVTTTPPGAEIHINEAYQGESPLRIEKKPGVYRVTIRKNNYRELQEEIVVEDNITKNVHRELDPILVEFRIDSDPSHAKVWLNSEDMGYTPARIHKEPGIYTVRITKPGYKNYAEEVHIKEGAFIQLKPVLEKEHSPLR